MQPHFGTRRGRRSGTRSTAIPVPILRSGILLLATALWTGCGGNGGGAQSRDAAASGRTDPPGEHSAQPAVAVAVEPVKRGSIASYYTATATLDPNKQAEVLARVSGIVLELMSEEGDYVAQDAPLLRIEEDEYRVRLKEADAELAKQKSRFDRVQKMFQQDLVAAEEFETAKNDLQVAESSRELAALELSYTQVCSPFSGRVVRRYVDPGQTVNLGTTLFTVADMSRLLARVHVPAREFRNIRVDQPVELSLDSSEDLLEGTITLVSPIIDPTSGTIKVTVEVTDYPKTTRPGDFAEVRIVTDRHSDAILVPKTAVITDKGDRVVYVAADSTAQRRVVEIGFQDDLQAEIASGLAPGELVVIQGQRSLKDGQPLKILDPVSFESANREQAGS
jgi:membrane fusion protein (multidrug efflux system)